MALHDFQCPICGHVTRDVNVPIDLGAAKVCVHCPVCPAKILMDWIPAIGGMDVGGVKGAAFKAFETYDGQNRKIRVENMRDLRRLERESEQQARNGEGQPLVFRRWSQTDSNKDVNTLGGAFAGGEQPTDAAKRKFGKTLQKSAEAPDTGYGPGVSDSNASALAD